MTVDLAAGTATDGFGDTDTLISIEDVRGTDSADTITGDDADNDIEGLGGDDVISTGAGRDWIRPGAGSDTIDGGSEPGMYDGDQVNYDDEEAATGITVTFSSDDDATVTDWNGDTDTLIDIEEVYGTRFADTMTGAEGRQWLGGGEGDDVLSGLGGDDDLMAGDGDDELYGGDGRDYLQPGAGVDFIDGGSEPGMYDGDTIVYRHDDNITGGVTVTWTTDDDGTAIDWTGATDTFVDVEGARGTEFADTMTGSEGRQQLQGEGGDDMLIGGDGDDDLNGGDGDDTLDGGQGGDFLQPGAGSDTIIGGENGPEGQTDTVAFIHTNNVTGGVDVVFSGELAGTIADYSGGTDTFTGVEQIWGTNFADTFTGAEGRQRFTGFGGDDTFDGGAGDQDRVSYEREQEDVGASQGIVVDLAAGTATDAYGDTDTLIGIEEIRGTDFDDVITGDGNRNELQGDDGDDIIDSGGGDNNYLDGGNGNDTLIARGDQNYVDGGDGDDTITFIGGPSGGADPGIGSDTITGVAGGWNRLEYRSLTGSVTIDIEAGTTVKSDGGTDNFTNIRTVGGGSGEDTLLGSDREDYEGFRASQGDDFVDGRGGYDDLRLFNSDEANLIVNFATGTVTGDFTGTDTFVNIEGATGSLNDDTFIGSDLDNIEFRGLQGDDTFTGGAGIEQISYEWDQFWDDGQNGVVVNLATGTATDGFGDTDTFTDIENLHGSAFDDMLTGDDGVNEIMDGEGDDTVDAAGGDDTLIIGLGTDTLTGGTGADVFEGTIEALDGDTIADFSLEDSFSILDPAGIQIGADITTDGTNFYIDIDGDGTADATVINGSGYTGLVNSEGGPAGGPVAAVIAVANAGFFTASVTEGNAGSAVAEVTLTRSGDVFAEVEVSYEIAGFGGNPADSADVTGFGTGSVTFMPGQEELTVSIEVLGDTTIEANEDLRLTVTSASSDGVLPAEIDGDETYVRILNDDVPPLVEVIGSRATEDSGAPLTFTFNRDADDLSGDLIVAYRLRGGDNDTDADPDDLIGGLPRFGSITIEAGETSAVLELEIVADGVLEPHETVYAEILSLDGPGAAGYEIGAGEATASIRNDDGIPPAFPIGQSAGNYGDPHLITLDGLAYDFQAVGEFTLLEAVSGDPLDIQVRYRPVEGSDVATRTTAVAMDMDDVRLVFDLDALSLIRVDGADLDLGAGGVASIGDAGGALYFDGEVYTVVFSTGDQVRITARDTFIDLSVGLTGGRDVRGLLGNGDGDAANDLALRDGTVLDQPVSFEDLYGAYADSWRITDGISLFDYADGEGTADFTDTSFPVGAISLDDIPEALLAAAQEAAAGIEDPVIRDAAILDFILSGDDSYIDAAEEVTTEVMDDTAPMDAPMIASAIGVSASASEVIEGDEGSQTVLYTLFRTGDLSETVEVSYGFTGDADASDVSGLTSGTIAFEAGQSEQTVEVSVLGDGIDEGDEAFIFSFDVTEGSPLVLSSQATVRIVDDDTATSEIEGTDRPDFLTGTDGDDVIRPLGGAVNLVAGGEGSDLFVFEGDSDDGMRQRYLITDYEVGVDGLSLGDAEIAGFTTRSNSVVIELAGDVPDKIVVFGIDSFDDLTIV